MSIGRVRCAHIVRCSCVGPRLQQQPSAITLVIESGLMEGGFTVLCESRVSGVLARRGGWGLFFPEAVRGGEESDARLVLGGDVCPCVQQQLHAVCSAPAAVEAVTCSQMKRSVLILPGGSEGNGCKRRKSSEGERWEALG